MTWRISACMPARIELNLASNSSVSAAVLSVAIAAAPVPPLVCPPR
jgi:hypothetical protein